nr:carboxypeptidase-like regulatory domain-containing protein [Candidatus Syntrophosphaera sp.]
MTAKVFCLLLLLTALASLAAGELPVTSYGDRDTGTITGIVRNTYNHPVQSATVSCGDVADTTDTSGSYRLTLPPGYWTLTVSHPLYVTFVRPAVPVTEGETTYCN